jgi:hypothetical protein
VLLMASVRKRVRLHADGTERVTWVADYFDQHRKRHALEFATRKEAKARLVEILGDVKRGVHTPERQSKNVYEAAQAWLEHGKAERLERGTLRGYEGIVEHHIGPTLGRRSWPISRRRCLRAGVIASSSSSPEPGREPSSAL